MTKAWTGQRPGSFWGGEPTALPAPLASGLGAGTSFQVSFCICLYFLGALSLQKGRLIRTPGRVHTGGGTRGSLTPGRKTTSPAGDTTDIAAMLPENEGWKGVRPTDASCSKISKPHGTQCTAGPEILATYAFSHHWGGWALGERRQLF